MPSTGPNNRTELYGGDTGPVNVYSITESGGTVYTAGDYYTSNNPTNSAVYIPCYWAGSTRTDLFGNGRGPFTLPSITVSGGTVYVAGNYFGNTNTIPCYWTGNMCIDLSSAAMAALPIELPCPEARSIQPGTTGMARRTYPATGPAPPGPICQALKRRRRSCKLQLPYPVVRSIQPVSTLMARITYLATGPAPPGPICRSLAMAALPIQLPCPVAPPIQPGATLMERRTYPATGTAPPGPICQALERLAAVPRRLLFLAARSIQQVSTMTALISYPATGPGPPCTDLPGIANTNTNFGISVFSTLGE